MEIPLPGGGSSSAAANNPYLQRLIDALSSPNGIALIVETVRDANHYRRKLYHARQKFESQFADLGTLVVSIDGEAPNVRVCIRKMPKVKDVVEL